MATYVTIDPHGGQLTIERNGDKYVLLARDSSTTLRIPLSNYMLRELAYHGALFYHAATGDHVLNPGYKHQGQQPREGKEPDHSQTPAQLLPRQKVRVRPRPMNPGCNPCLTKDRAYGIVIRVDQQELPPPMLFVLTGRATTPKATSSNATSSWRV